MQLYESSSYVSCNVHLQMQGDILLYFELSWEQLNPPGFRPILIVTCGSSILTVLSIQDAKYPKLIYSSDLLNEFPPKSVCLRKPFEVEPWTCSEEDVGNLFMVRPFTIFFLIKTHSSVLFIILFWGVELLFGLWWCCGDLHLILKQVHPKMSTFYNVWIGW